MPRLEACPFCGHDFFSGERQVYCPFCDEPISPAIYPDYQPLKRVLYSLSPTSTPPEDGTPLPPDATTRIRMAPRAHDETIHTVQPWYLKNGFILFALLFLAPCGILLLWLQLLRNPYLGGIFQRVLASFVFGAAWLLMLALLLFPQLDLPQLATGLIRQLTEQAQGRPVTVTLTQFKSLAPGDSYPTVKTLLGGEGELISESRLAGVPGLAPQLVTKVYEWRNPDGGSLSVVFVNERLSQKDQFGLTK